MHPSFYTQRLEEARASIKEQVQQETFLKIKEREEVINQLKEQLDIAKRKAEQGSMQLQGEIQELEIIELLQEFHPHDEITQSKKGTNAADIMQVVRTQNGAECGKIYYESKRTKSWSNDWVSKFKQDNLNAKADILVLVTNALPLIKFAEHLQTIDEHPEHGILKAINIKAIVNNRRIDIEVLCHHWVFSELVEVFPEEWGWSSKTGDPERSEYMSSFEQQNATPNKS